MDPLSAIKAQVAAEAAANVNVNVAHPLGGNHNHNHGNGYVNGSANVNANVHSTPLHASTPSQLQSQVPPVHHHPLATISSTPPSHSLHVNTSIPNNPLSTSNITNNKPAATTSAAAIDPSELQKQELDIELKRFFKGAPPPTKIQLFTPTDVSRDERGLMELAEHGCWRDVVKLAEILLRDADNVLKDLDKQDKSSSEPTHLTEHITEEGQNLQPHLIYRYYSYQVVGLMRLRRYDNAQNVFNHIGPFFSADKSYEYYRQIYANRKGNMIPFNLHLLKAELPHHQGKTKQTIDMLFSLLSWIRSQRKRALSTATTQNPEPSSPPTATLSASGSSDSISADTASSKNISLLNYRLKSVTIKLVNYHLALSASEQDFESAISLLTSLCEEYPNDLSIMSYLGRIYLQAGNHEMARTWFDKITQAYKAHGIEVHRDILLHESLMHMSKNDMVGAMKELSVALNAANSSSYDEAILMDDFLINNYAVAALYCNAIADGIEALEAYIRTDPIRRVRGVVLSNLRSLYDLQYAQTNSKKRLIEALAFMYGHHDLELSST